MTDGVETMMTTLALWTVLWILLFYALWFSAPLWMKGMSPSSKPHENELKWCARILWGQIHTVIVTAVSVPVLLALWYHGKTDLPPSSDVATCSTDDPSWASLVQWGLRSVSLFMSFTLADVYVAKAHNLYDTWDFMVHHAAFLGMGFICRSNCILFYNAQIMRPWRLPLHF